MNEQTLFVTVSSFSIINFVRKIQSNQIVVKGDSNTWKYVKYIGILRDIECFQLPVETVKYCKRLYFA